MSSTNRSKARDKHAYDYYRTPIEQIELFLKEFNKEVKLDWSKQRILDPSAGGDANHPMSYPTALTNVCGITDRNLFTVDIREDSLAEKKTDYLKMSGIWKASVIISNPPFGLSMPFIEKSLNEMVVDGGWVIMLLRLNFFESKERKEFWDKYMAKYIFVHHKRISFTDDGKTDSTSYGHFSWQKGNYPEFGCIKVI